MLARVLVHLVDGTYELFRAYYGAPSSVNARGIEVGASRALGASLVKLLRDPRVTHVACAFDHVIESFRNALFDGYKTGDGIEPALYGQFELAERVSRALGIVTWPMVEFEADDALATFAAQAADDARVEQVLVCSPDKDLAQCVRGERVVLFDRMREKRLDEAGVVEKFGVPPLAIADYLALVGDDADGIPGIPGFGDKSARAVLAAYGTLDAIPDDERAWSVKVRGAARLARALVERRQEARLYKTLATLCTDVPLGATVDTLSWAGPDEATLESVCAELEDPKLGERVRGVWAERRAGR